MTPGNSQRNSAAVIDAPEQLQTSARQPRAAIGASVARADGVPKVTGRAKYAGEESPPGTLHGVLVTSSICSGTVAAIDAKEALRLTGVVQVLTHESVQKVAAPPVPPAAQSFSALQDTRVFYEGQPVAIVLAETLEAAEEGAAKVHVSYRSEQPAMFSSAPTVRPKDAAAKNGYAFAAIETQKGSIEDRGQAPMCESMRRISHRRAITTRWSRRQPWPSGAEARSSSGTPLSGRTGFDTRWPQCSASVPRRCTCAVRTPVADSAPKDMCGRTSIWPSSLRRPLAGR